MLESAEENLAPFFNARFFTLLLVSATLTSFGWMHRVMEESDAELSLLIPWTGAVILLGLGMLIESPVYATLLWMALALLWLCSTVGLSGSMRNALFAILLAVIVFRTLAVEVGETTGARGIDPFFNLRFVALLSLGALMVFAGVLLDLPREGSRRKGMEEEVRFSHLMLLGANLSLLCGLSIEVSLLVERLLGPGAAQQVMESAKQFALSALWAAYASVLMAWGFFRENGAVRLAGLTLLGGVVLKLLFVDLSNVETGWRIASFLGVGALLLLVSLAYHRYQSEHST
ncbi:MAG: DUF2339 domain-containing protein, partial [Armatimonadetes bacterium]|nr:DUF2339 domain-containing protein [Armatimonadota bacterium]